KAGNAPQVAEALPVLPPALQDRFGAKEKAQMAGGGGRRVEGAGLQAGLARKQKRWIEALQAKDGDLIGLGGLGGLGRTLAELPQPLILREYAHQHASGAKPEERSDFVDTVFWHPALVLADGKGEVSFDLCDSVTSYQVTVLGHTLDGRIGAATSTIESRLPF